MNLTCAVVFSNPALRDDLMRRVDELDLSVRAQSCLQNDGIEYVWQLVEKSETGMLKSLRYGRKPIAEIKKILTERELGLSRKLSRELKLALRIHPSGDEPREHNPNEPKLPSLVDLEARIQQLTWLRDNYDAVKAGLKAFDWP